MERKLLTRSSKENLFTVDVLNKQIAENPLDTLFQETKKSYSADKIFEDDERINLKPATGEEIVRKALSRNNLNKSDCEPFALRYRRVNASLMLRYLSMSVSGQETVQLIS